eukprot:1843294-Amphidinium_carterae.1
MGCSTSRPPAPRTEPVLLERVIPLVASPAPALPALKEPELFILLGPVGGYPLPGLELDTGGRSAGNGGSLLPGAGGKGTASSSSSGSMPFTLVPYALCQTSAMRQVDR